MSDHFRSIRTARIEPQSDFDVSRCAGGVMETKAESVVHDFGVSRVITAGMEVIVQLKSGDGWRDVRSFHRISDDYAFTNARDEAQRRARPPEQIKP